MLAKRKSRRAVAGAAVLAGVLAVSGFAFTDVLGVPSTSHAGDGAANVENIVATNVHYALNSTNPNVVDSIEFDISHAVASGGAIWTQPVATGATITAGSSAGHWYSCAVTGTVNGVTATSTHPVCLTTGSALAAADVSQIRVVAAD